MSAPAEARPDPAPPPRGPAPSTGEALLQVEGLTKQAGVTVLLSEEAYNLVGHEDFFDCLGEFSVKGMDKPIAVYTIKQEPARGGPERTTEGGNV